MAKKKAVANVASKISNFAANRVRKLARHLKKHPNDKQAIVAASTPKPESTRSASKSKMGWMASDKNVTAFINSKLNGQVTTYAAKSLARIYRLTQKAPYHALATFIPNGDKLDIVYKNVSKLSNFKGKGKGSTKAKEDNLI